MSYSIATARRSRQEGLIERIRCSVIGDDAVLEGPFGPRRMVYADATASGRSLAFVEDFIRDQVLPLYGNTHTEASATGRRTTALREEARAVIHRAVNGGPEDVVLFCGRGATGAIDKLIRLLGADRRRAAGRVPRSLRAPLERAAVAGVDAEVVPIRRDREGRVDVDHLTYELRRHADRAVKIGSFSAASNVTGIITAVDEVAITLHRHGALSCWDYAAAGPYLPIDMNAAPDRSPTGSSRTRTRSSSRRTSSSAAPGRPACSSSSARCCATAFRRYPAAAPCCS